MCVSDNRVTMTLTAAAADYPRLAVSAVFPELQAIRCGMVTVRLQMSREGAYLPHPPLPHAACHRGYLLLLPRT